MPKDRLDEALDRADRDRHVSQNGHTNGAAPLHLIDLRTIPHYRVEWFETNFYPQGELTVVNGDGGVGKTTGVLDLLARASSHRPMPSGLRHDRPLRCLIVAEEDRHGLLRAKLEMAQADLAHIRLIDGVGTEKPYAKLQFPAHARALLAEIEAGDWDVVLIDALLNHLDDDVDTSKPRDMRRALGPLIEIAHETGITLIAIRHLGKGAGPASQRGLGSVEIRNVARSELTIGIHPETPGLVVVAISKKNLAVNGDATAAYRLEAVDVLDARGLPTSIPRVAWEEFAPQISADILIAPADTRRDPEERPKRLAAIDWLRAHLAAGGARAMAVIAAGQEAGHSKNMLYKVFKKAGIRVEQRGFPSQAFWARDDTPDDEAARQWAAGEL